MKPSFIKENLSFYNINQFEGEVIINHLKSTCGLYEIPNFIWKKYLIRLPSPIQSPDCVAVYVSGAIPTSTVYFYNTTLDIIRKENNPKRFEPEYNCYYHYFMKDSNGSLYISNYLKPNYHWAVYEELEEIYPISFPK